jgi:hypothetical protein
MVIIGIAVAGVLLYLIKAYWIDERKDRDQMDIYVVKEDAYGVDLESDTRVSQQDVDESFTVWQRGGPGNDSL